MRLLGKAIGVTRGGGGAAGVLAVGPRSSPYPRLVAATPRTVHAHLCRDCGLALEPVVQQGFVLATKALWGSTGCLGGYFLGWFTGVSPPILATLHTWRKIFPKDAGPDSNGEAAVSRLGSGRACPPRRSSPTAHLSSETIARCAPDVVTPGPWSRVVVHLRLFWTG